MPFRIFIANRNRSEKSLREEFGDIPVFDVTFAGRDPIFSTLSPMYPHGDLIVPFSRRELTACSLEAVWQGLKVFEREGAAFWWFKKSGDSGIKRVAGGSRGMVLGHQQGVYTDRPLLNVIEARSLIYAPLFKWQLKHHCEQALALIQEAHAKSDIVLLEAGNDSNIYDISTPLVHSALIRLFVLGEYPECGIGHVWTPLTQEEHLADIERRRRERAERIAAQKAKVHGSLGFFFDDESSAPQSAGKAERSPTSAVGTKSVPAADTTVAGDAISTPVGGQTSADSVPVPVPIPVPVPTAHTLAGTDSHSVSESANSADLVGTTSTLVTVATEETPVTAEAIGTADSVQTIVCKAPESPLPQTQSTTDLKAQDLLLSTDVATDKVVGEIATTSSTAEITAVVAEDTATPINAEALDLAVAVDVAEAVDAADTTEDKHSTAEAEHVSKSTDASSSVDAATESNPTTATTTVTTATIDTTTSSAEQAKAVADTVDAILSPQSVTKTKPHTKRTRKTSGASTSRKRKAETKAATEADTQSLSLLSLIED